jgi:hypothetical protein
LINYAQLDAVIIMDIAQFKMMLMIPATTIIIPLYHPKTYRQDQA